MLPWQKISSKVVHKNPWWKVEEHQVLRPNGKAGHYFIVRKPPFVSVIAVTKNRSIYFIKQTRYPTGLNGWELPQGNSDVGEDLLAAAKRELAEETGLSTTKWTKLGDGLQSEKGITNALAHTFIAEMLTQTGKHDQDEEGIEDCRPMTCEEIKQVVKRGEMSDDVTLASLTLAFVHGYIDWSK